MTDLNSTRVGRRIVETLVTFPDESTQIVPGLAESWTISKDGLRYIFKLRKGIAFHDGTPFNAEAVKFSIERQILPEHPFNKLGKYPFANYFFGNVKGVEVVDPHTVEFVLKEPRASFLAVLTAGAASIVSPTAVRKLGADYALTPVGTGPFRYASWDRGQRVVLEKNPSYWRHPVALDRVVYRPIVEDQARLTELLTGTLDMIVGVPPDFVAQLENHPKLSLLKQVGSHVWYLGINNQKKPFADKRVRQAMNYAVNKEAIARDVLKGTGWCRPDPVLPKTWGAEPRLEAVPLRPRARQETPGRRRLPERLLDHALDAGIGLRHAVAGGHVDRHPVEPEGGRYQRRDPDHGVGRLPRQAPHPGAGAVRALVDGGQRGPRHGHVPAAALEPVDAGGANRAMYKNPRFDELLHQGRLATDQARRAELYREAQRILMDDPPWIFIDHEVQIAAFSKRIQNFKLHPSFDLRVETISLR